PDEKVREWAIFCIPRLFRDPSPAAEALGRRLDDPVPYVRYLTILALARMGGKARPVVPKLRALVTDETVALRPHRAKVITIGAAAADAIREIDPDAAKGQP